MKTISFWHTFILVIVMSFFMAAAMQAAVNETVAQPSPSNYGKYVSDIENKQESLVCIKEDIENVEAGLIKKMRIREEDIPAR